MEHIVLEYTCICSDCEAVIYYYNTGNYEYYPTFFVRILSGLLLPWRTVKSWLRLRKKDYTDIDPKDLPF